MTQVEHTPKQYIDGQLTAINMKAMSCQTTQAMTTAPIGITVNFRMASPQKKIQGASNKKNHIKGHN